MADVTVNAGGNVFVSINEGVRGRHYVRIGVEGGVICFEVEGSHALCRLRDTFCAAVAALRVVNVGIKEP